MTRLTRTLLLLTCLALVAPATLAQEVGMTAAGQDAQSGTEAEAEKETEAAPKLEPTKSAREVLEKEKEAEELLKERAATDSKSLEKGLTPLAAILEMTSAFRAGDYARAAEFVDMRYLDDELADADPEGLIRSLSFMIGQQVVLDITDLSDEPEGHLDDGLPNFRDLVTTVTLSDGEVPIYIQRVPDDNGGRTWKISNSTVRQIPRMWDELGFHPLAEYLFTVLPDFTFMGLLNWQLLGIVLALPLAWLLSALVTSISNRLVQLIPNIFPGGIERFFHRPLRLFLFIIITVELVEELGLSMKLRILLRSSGLSYVAYTILLLGIISLLRDYNIRRLQRLGQHNYAALLRPVTNMVKVLVVLIVVLIWADNAGYSMTTILAGLGVGSLAVALAAQKTLENLIGAITLYTARPIAPGDFCRFGTVTGTVEEIGLRSTAIRTLNRTLVHVPNSVLSSVDIENFSARDRIRYFRNARILAQSADQVRVILADIRSILYAHPMIHADTVSVRLEDIDDAAVQLRLDAGVKTTDFQEYLAVAEDLNLRFIEVIDRAGADLSGPGQLRILRRGGESEKAQSQHVKDMLALWREQDSAPFPDFSAEDIAAMGDSLVYGKG